jgi:hypothetical protein
MERRKFTRERSHPRPDRWPVRPSRSHRRLQHRAGWSRDVSAEIAREISERASARGEELTGPVQAFVEYEMERARRHARRAPVV